MGRGVGAGGRSARVRSRDRSSSSSVLRSMSSSNDVSSILALSASRASCSRACRALGCAPPLFGGVHDGVQPARERRPPFQLSNLHVVVLLWLEHASLWESAPRVIGSVLAPMSADVGEDVISALAGMNPMNMRERSRFARWLFRQESSIVRLAAALLALLAVFMTVHVHAHLSGVPVVTDGDTLKIGSERIRLHGIDAPESAQRCRARGQTWACGAAATRALRERIASLPVECDDRDRDRYGRIVAVCRVAGAGERRRSSCSASRCWRPPRRQRPRTPPHASLFSSFSVFKVHMG